MSIHSPYLFILFICVHVHGCECVSQRTQVVIRGKLVGVGSLLLARGFQGSHSGRQRWHLLSLPLAPECVFKPGTRGAHKDLNIVLCGLPLRFPSVGDFWFLVSCLPTTRPPPNLLFVLVCKMATILNLRDRRLKVTFSKVPKEPVSSDLMLVLDSLHQLDTS